VSTDHAPAEIPGNDDLPAGAGASLSSAVARLSINEMTTYRWSLPEEVAAFREAGIDAIGIWRPKLTDFGEERGIDLIRESGMHVSSVSWAGGFTGSNGHSFEESLLDARDAVAVAGQLRAESLVIVSGSRAGHTRNHARRLLVEALKALGDDAGERNLTLALQPMHPMFAQEWTFLTSLDETLDVIDRCDHDAVQIAFDVYHLWQEPSLLERIGEVAPLVSTVQLNDWRDPPRSEHDRCLPGDGEIPLREIVSAFIDADYDGYFEISVWSEELWHSNYADLLGECRRRFLALCPR
jgi:sugar phosphate isomerase/epimerase